MKKNSKLTKVTKTIFYATIIGTLIAFASPAKAQCQPGERVWSPPVRGAYYSMQRTNFPPIPLLPYDVPIYFLDQPSNGLPCFLYDDRDIDYSGLQSITLSSEESSESEEPSF